MTEITTNSVDKPDFTQKHEKVKKGHAKSCHFTISQQEALRRATLLKHRKVSTQLKLDMVQRQLSELRSSSNSDRQFYRSQLSELSNELEDLGNSLEKVERNAFYARRRLLRCHGGQGILQLSASHPAIYSSNETLDQSSKQGLKSRMHHLLPSPTLDMVQRQLSELRSSSNSDRQFYRSQLSELSNELEDLGNSLEKVERNAFYARRRLLRCHGGQGILQLSASHPAIYSSNETLDQSSKQGLKSRMHHLLPSPTLRFKKRHLMGELRSAASLSSLHVKSTSHDSCDDITTKHSTVWKAPLRFLGHIVDNRICRKIWRSTKRTKSEDNVSEEPKTRKSLEDIEPHTCNGHGKKDDAYSSSSSSETESSDESDEEEKEWDMRKTNRTHIWKGPVERKVSSSQKQQIDPAILAEIDEFEQMAAQYIKLHS